MRYKAQKPVGTGRYASGQRRCQICEIFIKWEGLWCPCCGYRLRTKPRNLKYKAKLRARVEADTLEARARTRAARAPKERTPCRHCEKMFVYAEKHERKCKKNPEAAGSRRGESIAIKA